MKGDILVTLASPMQTYSSLITMGWNPLTDTAPPSSQGLVASSGYACLAQQVSVSQCQGGALLALDTTCSNGLEPIGSGAEFILDFVAPATSTPIPSASSP